MANTIIGLCTNPVCPFYGAPAPQHPTVPRCVCGAPLIAAVPLPAMTAALMGGTDND